MGWIINAACDSCAWQQELLIGSSRCYRLANGNKLPINVRLAWCASCQQIVEAEELLSTGEIDAEATRAAAEEPFDLELWHKARMKKLYGLVEYDSRDKVRQGVMELLHWPFQEITRKGYLQILRNMLRWRRTRQAGPKCLCCGSIAIQYLNQDEETWGLTAHPGCPGTISASCVGHAQLFQSLDVFSEEGVAVALDANS